MKAADSGEGLVASARRSSSWPLIGIRLPTLRIVLGRESVDAGRKHLRDLRRCKSLSYLPGCSAIDHLIGNLVADTNHARRRTIDELRNALAPLAGVSANLVVKECIQTVDGDDARDLQFPAQQTLRHDRTAAQHEHGLDRSRWHRCNLRTFEIRLA